LPLVYTLGFHPKPDMSFGPALSLGVASLCEAIDIKLTGDLDPSALLDGLSAGAQPGLRFVGGVRLGAGDGAIARVVDTARYVVGIPRSAMDSLGGREGIRDCIGKVRQAEALFVMRRIDGIGKRVNVREFLRALHLEDDEGTAALAMAGIAGDLMAISAEVEVRGSGGVKIAEVVETVFGNADLPHRAVRTGLGARTAEGGLLSPLELDALRAARAARSLVEARP
jgi:radical SAM-linked protein